MLPQPPPSLHVEATHAETRILLDHGRPRSPLALWKRVTVAIWLTALIAGWIVPVLFCPAALSATVVVGFVFALDAMRTVVDRVVLRVDQLKVVRRGAAGLRTRRVPWDKVRGITLASEGGGRRTRDALLIEVDGEPRPLRLAPGRARDDLDWMRTCLLTVRDGVCGQARSAEAVLDQVADVAEPTPAES